MARRFKTYQAALEYAEALFARCGIVAGIVRKGSNWIVG